MSADFPLRRSDGLIVEELDGQLLVYDSQTNLAHALDAEAAAVWRACDGHTDTSALAARCARSQEDVRMTLARLGELGLLDTPGGDQDTDTRRSALRKIAIGGAGLASASAVSSILVPAAAAQGSCVPAGECPFPGHEASRPCCTGQLPIQFPFPGCPSGVLCCVPAGTCAVEIGGVPPPESCCTHNAFSDGSCNSGYRCT